MTLKPALFLLLLFLASCSGSNAPQDDAKIYRSGWGTCSFMGASYFGPWFGACETKEYVFFMSPGGQTAIKKEMPAAPAPVATPSPAPSAKGK